MKSLKDILTTIKTALETDLPDLLYANDLDDFDTYRVGGSRNPKEVGCFVYQDMVNYGYERNTVSIIIQLQLYNIQELEAADYADVVSDYMRDYEPVNIECDLLETIEVDTWPIEQVSTTFVYINCTWTEELDSCDN